MADQERSPEFGGGSSGEDSLHRQKYKGPIGAFRFWKRVWDWTGAFGTSRFARLWTGCAGLGANPVRATHRRSRQRRREAPIPPSPPDLRQFEERNEETVFHVNKKD